MKKTLLSLLDFNLESLTFCIKKYSLATLFLILFSVLGYAQNGSVPELIYYKFNNPGSTVTNEASSPVGNITITLPSGLSIGTGGILGTNGLVGTGSGSAAFNTGWNTTINGDFTLAFWTSNVPSSTTLYYIFGDAGASTFRCFTNGAAGAGNWMVRGGGLPDITFTNAATVAAHMMHLVYDASAGMVYAYIDGVIVSQTSVSSAINITGSGLTVGGYGSNTNLNGVLDEFRWYNRALDAQEIFDTYNRELPLVGGHNDAGIYALTSPVSFCPGMEDIKIKVRNFGANVIDSVKIAWSLDGVAQTPYNLTLPLDTFGGSGIVEREIILGSHTFTNVPVNFKAWTFVPNGGSDTTNNNDTLTATLQSSLSGVYTIDAGSAAGATNYQSFGDFIDDLEQYGVCGPVTANVVSASGPYNELVNIGNIPGASAVNTIRINGNGETVQYTNTSSDRQLLTLDGAKYVTIDSLKFKAQDATYGWGALITNGSEYDSIMRCEFDVSSVTSTSSVNSAGITFSAANTSATSIGSNGSHCYIGYNHVKGTDGSGSCYYGITVAGTSDSNIIAHNLVENFNTYGVYINGASGTKVLYNDVNRATKTSVSTFYGIYTTGATPGTQIIGNRIHAPGGTSGGTGSCYVMYLLGDGTATNPVLVANNAVYDLNQGGILRGIYLSTSPHNLIYHNTINIDQTLSSTSANYGIYATGTNTGTKIKNNNINITGGGSGDIYGFYYNTATSIDDAQKNNIYVNTQNGTDYYGYYTVDYTTQALFQAANPTLEVSSPSVDPMFSNVSTGDLTPLNPMLMILGENLTTLVPEDILETSRNVPPTIGAFEGIMPSCVPPFASTMYLNNVSTNDASINWDASITPPGNGYQYYLSTASTPPTSSTVATGSTMDTIVHLTNLSSNTEYYLWVRSICSSSDESIWSSVFKFRTLCLAGDVPYYAPIAATLPSELPECMSIQTVNTQGYDWETAANTSSYGFTGNYLQCQATSASGGAMNSWIFTNKLNLESGTNYKLKFRYGAKTTSKTEKLAVAIGTAAMADSMTSVLFDDTNIVMNGSTDTTVYFTVATNGVYVIGFQGHSSANQNYVLLSDISVDSLPTCHVANSLVANNITTNSADLAWFGTALKYRIEYGESGFTLGTGTQVSTNSGTYQLTGLDPNTTYDFYVKDVCVPGVDSADWSAVETFTTLCNVPSVNVGHDTSFCEGGQITLYTGNADTNSTVLWSTGATADSIVVNSYGEYYATITNEFDCSAADTVFVNVKPYPVVDLGTDTSICGNNTVVLDAGTQPLGTTFFWNTAATSQTITVADSGWYKVIADNVGCVTIDSVHVSKQEMPNVTGITGTSENADCTFDFVAINPEHVTDYYWDFGDGSNATGTTPTHTYSNNGSYDVTLIVSNECGTDSVVTAVNCSDLGIGQLDLNNEQLKLYPNPARDRITLQNESVYQMKTITVYNVLGQVIFNGKADATDRYTLNVQSYASGIYNVKITFKNGSWIQRKFEIRK